MNRNFNPFKSLPGVLFLAAIAGCSSKPESYASNADATPEIAKAESALKQAEIAQVSIFAPASFESAMKAFENSKETRTKNASNEAILKSIEKTNQLTAEAIRKADVAKSAVPGVAEARSAALSVQADKSSPKDYSNADTELAAFSAAMEKGKIKDSEKVRKSLLSKYQNLEIKGVHAMKLDQSIAWLKQAKDEGAKENAPKSWIRANQIVDKASGLIQQDPHDLAVINPAAAEAQFETEKLLRVTRKAKASGGAKSEAVILQSEAQQQSFAKQSQALASAKDENQAKTAEVQNLSEVNNLQDKMAMVRSKFDPSEADVYQQGKSVTIRLKTIQFPSNKSEIPSTSFATLKKVEESIAALNSTHVTIEGHTDTIGSATLNGPLSQSRAESVKKYIGANLPMKDLVLSAEGFGSNKPLASNKTQKGRAQNRRIDIVIEAM